MSDIRVFVELRLREAKSSEPARQQMLSALEMIAEVHRDGDGYCDECYRAWPCLTIRHVAWTWRGHPDYDHAWHWTIDDLPQRPLTDAEQTYLIEHGGVDPDAFTPERMAEAGRLLVEHLEFAKYVLPIRGPWGLREVIDAMPDMGHAELVELLNAPLAELNDHSPIEWLADGGAASVVIEELAGPDARANAAARLWAEVGRLNQDRARGRLTGRDFEDAEADIDHRLLDLVMGRAEEVWPRPVVKEWMTGSNDYLGGARPLDVLRLRGPAEVLAALDAEEQGAIG